MKVRKIGSLTGFSLAALCLLWLHGCGGGGAANVITITVTSSVGNLLILGQSTTLTATVNGATNVNVDWTPQPCQYTTTPSGSTTPSAPVNCPTDGSFGTLTNPQASGTATYTAPNVLPDQTKFPSLQILIVAVSAQDKTKSGKATLLLDSGISVALNPNTATVPTKEKQQFSAALANDPQNKGVTWLLTQETPTSTSPFPSLKTCSPACGTITPDKNNPNIAVYTAPDTVPTGTTTSSTPANLTIVATSAVDNTRFATGTITIIAGGPITFNGITPTIAPQSATFWDVYLDAPNISSSSQITLTDSLGGKTIKLASSGQVKVLFPVPTSTTPNPPSTGARLRLLAQDLAVAGPVTVSVTDPAQPVTPSPTGVFTYNIIPVRPASTASVPDSVVQGKLAQDTRVTVDGGYFGPGGNLARIFFQGNAIPQDSNHPSSSRQLNTLLSTAQIDAASPGLYPLSVASTVTPAPSPNNPAVSNIAVFPDYSITPPSVVSGPAGIPAGTNPSAVDIDPALGILVVAETGSNAVQFYSIGAGTLTPINSAGAACGTACPVAVGKVPTGLSVNRANHTVAVVNYQDQSVSVLPIPGAPVQAPGTPFTVDISGALQKSVSPAPLPYSIGVDPDSNLALVAYSSTSVSSAANLGFVVNLNPDSGSNPYGCGLDHAINPASTKVGQCLYAQVTLNTGAFPQIALAPHGHLALVTPGGSGVVRGVDVTKPSASVGILSATLTASLATVTTTKPHGLIPGNAGTVLITGVKGSNGANDNTFNGVFTVNVTSSNSFTYVVNSAVGDTGTGGTVFFSGPNLIFSISSTAQGIAINPITRTAALADANATGLNGPQIDLLNSLDQSVTSITFLAGCTAFTTPCSSAPELLRTADVAWQPYTNSLVSYNPQQNQLSVSDPVGARRYAFACADPLQCQVNPTIPSQITLKGAGSATITVQNGTTNSLALFGGLAVDPATNQAFVVKSGSGGIDIVNLGPGATNTVKPVQITELIVPSPAPGPGVIGGVPNALVPQATLTSASDLVGVQIFGSGFDSGTLVRLDGTGFASTALGHFTFVSSRQITVTVPASFLSRPHHYTLDLINGKGLPSNVTDFYVIQSVDLSKTCTGANAQPSSVAVADQLANGPFSPIAVVSVSGCNSISVIDINPASATFGQILGNPIGVGTSPQGIAISQHLGFAVIANNGSGNASIVNLISGKQPVPAVSTGTNPSGVAIDDATGAAIIANTGSNTVSLINLGLLFPPSGTTPPASLTATTIGGIQQPIAVAIDPDRGTNNQGIAVVTALQIVPGALPNGALAVVDIGLATPRLSATLATGSVVATPTGIVFDPTVATGTANLGLFYANSSGSNVITAFNPDNGGGSSVSVGINPTSLAMNPQTGAILTANSASNTVSIVDTLSNPLKTRQTLGLPGSPSFGVAIDQFTNLAVVVDQANSRVLLFPMPN